MSSIHSSVSQRLTKNLVTLYNSLGYTALFTETNFTNWANDANNRAYISKVGNLYIITDASPDEVLRGVSGFTVLDHSNVNTGIPLNDMGYEVRVGSPDTNDYVVFRRVQVPNTIANTGGGGQVGYVVIDNNMSDLTRPRFQVTVARV